MNRAVVGQASRLPSGRLAPGFVAAWFGCGCCSASHSLPQEPLRMKQGGRPFTTPACKSSRIGMSPLVK